MRWLGLVFVLMSSACLAQETTDTTSSPFFKFQQEGLLSNRSHWTFEDNPALAGFDRKLNVTYDYSARNLSITVPGENGYQQLAFQQHAAMVDLAFGGEPMNWGVGLVYRHTKEGFFEQQKALLAHSFRVKMGNHRLLFGLHGGVVRHSENYDALFFPDQIDPRMGVIYPTNEQAPPSASGLSHVVATGITYQWNRLRVDAVFQNGPHQVYSYKGGIGDGFYFRAKAIYYIKLAKDVSVAPEILVFNATQYGWIVNPSITLQYKNVAFSQVSLDRLNKLQITAGYFFKEKIGVTAGFGSYFDQNNTRSLGLATVSTGIRVQFPTRK